MALICDPAAVTIADAAFGAWPKVTLVPLMKLPPDTVMGEADSTSEPTLIRAVDPITNPPGV